MSFFHLVRKVRTLFFSPRQHVVPARRGLDSLVSWAGVLLLALVTVGPLLAVRRPAEFLSPYASRASSWLSEGIVCAALILVLNVRAALDRRTEPAPYFLTFLFAVAAGAMTAIHLEIVDSDPARLYWQRYDIYLNTINGTGDPVLTIPHRYRPLPYGFVRLLECITRDWVFAIVCYRWFFTWWFLWGAYKLARRYAPPDWALLAVAPVVFLYPLSVHYYWGQLADPLSHALFMLSLLWVIDDRPGLLATSLALGVAAKETVVLVVIAYFACYWRRGVRAWAVSAGLGLACVAAYFAVRVPQGWRPGLLNVNGLERLMVGTNLGFGEPLGFSAAPRWENYLHPVLFVGPFLPPLISGWRRVDPKLRTLCATLVPLLLVSNLCFGWLYESRNYMPLVPLLATAVLSLRRADSSEKLPQTGGDANGNA
jgi:hypothetical protein